MSIILTNRPVAAAETEFARIHNHHLTVMPGHEFYGDSDPKALAEYFKKNLGFTPAMPELGHGMKMRGCCVDHFRGALVGSYVVDTPQGVISLIVVNDLPESFAKTKQIARDGQTLWASSFGHCNMVSTRLNGYTYCAVGNQDVAHDTLADLLLRLLSPSK